MRENQEFAAKGAKTSAPHLQGKIRARFEPVKKAYEAFLAQEVPGEVVQVKE